jgi:hypothetical protein
MTPTESNFYRNGSKPFRIKVFRAVLACVFGTKTMTKQNRQLKFKFFLPNTQPIRNFERILAQ